MSHLVLLFDLQHGYIIRTPAPYNLETALDHLSQIGVRAENVELRTYEEVGRERYSLRPEAQDARETIPAPAPAPSEEAERMCGAERGANGGG